LVNALCLGIADKDKVIRARAGGAGNLLMLVGADTGRDGIYGASGLASRTFEDEQELRSTVQVGNPFLEKLLIEACLELAQTDWMVIRKAERSVAIPAETVAKRAAILAECDRLTAAVTAAQDMPSFITAVQSANWS
jgi:hypothetical protein